MRIQLLSDIHNEMNHYEAVKTNADVVVLAGDIFPGSYAVEWAKLNFPTTQVLLVPGNHEYYSGQFPDVLLDMKKQAIDSNVKVLEKDQVIIGDVTFLGCTLWTNFDLLGNKSKAMLEAEHRMNDYYQIETEPKKALTPEDIEAEFHRALNWLDCMLKINQDQKTVVITHHAPSKLSIPVEREDDILSAAYASNLDEFIRYHTNIKYWLHGHVHHASNYLINETNVVSNPKGYPHALVTGFKPDLILEI